MKHGDSENRLKIEPNIIPFHKKKIFSGLNYIEMGVILLVVVGIIILIFANDFFGKFREIKDDNTALDTTEQREILGGLSKEIPQLSEEEKKNQISILNSLSKEMPVFSPEEEQSRIEILNNLKR